MIDYEFYPTPDPFTHWLFDELPIHGRVFEPCVGDGAIVRATWPPNQRHWFTNDLDPRWPADVHKDARDRTLWEAHEFDWTVSNPPFTPAVDIIDLAIEFSRVGVAMHLRASIHEVLKKDKQRRTWAGRAASDRHPLAAALRLSAIQYDREVVDGFGLRVLVYLAEGSGRAAVHPVRARISARRARRLHAHVPRAHGCADARSRS